MLVTATMADKPAKHNALGVDDTSAISRADKAGGRTVVNTVGESVGSSIEDPMVMAPKKKTNIDMVNLT